MRFSGQIPFTASPPAAARPCESHGAGASSQLTARIRDQAAASRQREARTNALYEFTRAIAGAIGLDDLVPGVASHVSGLLGADVAVLMVDGDRLVVRGTHPASRALGEPEIAAATRVWRHDETAWPATDTLPGSDWLFMPLETARGVVGVIGVRSADGARTLSLDQRELLRSLARQTAIAIERCRIDVVLEERPRPSRSWRRAKTASSCSILDI